jgi:V/A-type H+-transporting ATPase subunit I
MLLPAEMLKVTVGVHRSHQDRFFSDIHEAGILEITNIWESKSDLCAFLSEGKKPPETERYAEYSLKISSILDALHEVREPEPNIVHELFFARPTAKTRVVRKNVQQLFAEIDDALKETEDALRLRNELIALRERSHAVRMQLESVEYLLPFDFDLSYLGESELLYILPILVDSVDFDRLIDQIQKTGIDTYAVLDRRRGEQVIVIIATLSTYRERLDVIVKDPAFRVIETGNIQGKPSVVIDNLRLGAGDLETGEHALLSALVEIDSTWRQILLTLQEELEIEKDRASAFPKCGQTRDVIIIQGWIAAKDTDKLQKLCETATEEHGFCDLQKPKTNPDGVPIKYDNPSWLQPFELITTMFSRPRYDEIDPTVFIAPILVAFFGLMLGDAGYGSLIVLLGYLLHRGAGRVSTAVNNMSIILMVAGLAAIIAGILQGGFFGDFLPRFFGVEPPLVRLNPLEAPIAFLSIALIIGLLHLNLGLIIAVYQNVQRGRYKDIMYDQIPWFILQPSAAILLFAFFGWASISPAVMTAAYIGVIIGACLVFLRGGPLGFFGLTGYLGDWLSYARLLALALATGGIAMTVNILAEMVAGIYYPVTVILAVLVLIGGHAFNFVLQSLGAFVHSLRLQYVEFFGKFYSGGGKEFTPFSARRSGTELVGDEA